MTHIASQRLGQVANVRVSGVDKKSYEGETLVRLCNYTDVYYNDNIVDTLPLMAATASLPQIERLTVLPGDVIITKDSETAEDIGIPAYVQSVGEDVVCGYHLALIRPYGHKIHPRYLFWQMKSRNVAAQWEGLAKGVTRVSLPSYAINSLSLMGPADLNVQARIADFLDRETAKIDALVEKQQDLIAGLQLHRRAAIMHYVLGRDRPPFKTACEASPWVPEVPTSWGFSPLGYRFEVVLGKMLDAGRAPRVEDVELPYIRAANIQEPGLDLSSVNSMPFSTGEAAKFSLRAGDLLVVEGGSVGVSVVLGDDMEGWAFQKTVNRVRSRGDSSTRYLDYVLRAYRDAGVFGIICGGSTIAHLTAEKLSGLRIPAPPPLEQEEIAERLDRESTRIDRLIATAERMIELSQERRAALITAAVTGQIDVAEMRICEEAA